MHRRALVEAARHLNPRCNQVHHRVIKGIRVTIKVEQVQNKTVVLHQQQLQRVMREMLVVIRIKILFISNRCRNLVRMVTWLRMAARS